MNGHDGTVRGGHLEMPVRLLDLLSFGSASFSSRLAVPFLAQTMHRPPAGFIPGLAELFPTCDPSNRRAGACKGSQTLPPSYDLSLSLAGEPRSTSPKNMLRSPALGGKPSPSPAVRWQGDENGTLDKPRCTVICLWAVRVHKSHRWLRTEDLRRQPQSKGCSLGNGDKVFRH